MKTGRYSLFQLLNNPEIEQIIIPEIQRDYVWEEQNVRGLLESIKNKYDAKENVTLTINAGNAPLSGSMNAYLSKEYEKLVYSTKIGFIYAYHDPNYPGKFFLIDGQQRITTLYLLLIALYKEQPDRWFEFKERYFAQQLPKLDYRVREITHDFLIQLIKHELSHQNISFDNSVNYYKVIYDKDETTKNMWHNYHIICDFVQTVHDIPSFTEYLEHFVEFNFFDTNISAQGERLYLYMNSRGENLSYQETIKSIIIGKGDQKLDYGRKWEEWQDFFWQNKGQENPNADKGFQNFLKWAVILHICSHGDTVKKAPKMVNDRKQSEVEIIEDYIRVESPESDKSTQQYRDIRSYIKENQSFNAVWLEQVMQAVYQLSSLTVKEFFVDDLWLSREKTTIEYVVLLPILRYLMRFPEKEPVYLKRLAYFLKNKSYNDTHYKAPDRAVYLMLTMVNAIPESGDVFETPTEKFKNVFADIDKEVAEMLLNTPQRQEWESQLAKFVQNDLLEKFLQGNCKCLLKMSETPDDFATYLGAFVTEILTNKDTRELRQKLLRYGAFPVESEGGSGNLTNKWLRRFNFISNDDDWREILSKDTFIESHLKPFLTGQTPEGEPDKWMVPFLEHIDLFKGSFKYLWEESNISPRIILLDSVQAGERKSWHVENILLKKRLKQEHLCAWNWNYQTTVIPFVLNADNEIEEYNEKGTDVPENPRTNYFMDVIFEWQQDGESKWYVSVGKRNYDKQEMQPDEHISELFRLTKDKHYVRKEPIYTHDPLLSMEKNIEQLCKELISFRAKLVTDHLSRMFA